MIIYMSQYNWVQISFAEVRIRAVVRVRAVVLHHVLNDEIHPLHDRLLGQLIARSGRLRLPSAVTGRYLSSFVYKIIRHHIANYERGVGL